MELKPAPGLRWAYLIKEPFSMFQIPVALHEMKLKKVLDGCSYERMTLVPGGICTSTLIDFLKLQVVNKSVFVEPYLRKTRPIKKIDS